MQEMLAQAMGCVGSTECSPHCLLRTGECISKPDTYFLNVDIFTLETT